MKTSNTELRIEVTKDELPMHCPTPETSLWNSHPRVYIPVGDSADGIAACHYCGTVFHLVEKKSGGLLNDEMPKGDAPLPPGTA